MQKKHHTVIARKLRKKSTPQEIKVWARLRNRQVAGYKFRRQVPIAGFVADFYCAEKKLVIEIDGSQHMDRQEYDEKRTAILQKQGFRVLRFWNSDVETNVEGVFDEILNALQSALYPPSPPLRGPSPARGEEA